MVNVKVEHTMLTVATLAVTPVPVPFDTVQICPVGALTAKPYRFSARPWDLEQVESTCTTCSVGCRAAVQSSSGEVTRLIGVDYDPVNWAWLCDKGRFAYEATNGQEEGEPLLPLTSPRRRLNAPLLRRDGELVEVPGMDGSGSEQERQSGSGLQSCSVGEAHFILVFRRDR